jgi:quinol monooxygenase YgiN
MASHVFLTATFKTKPGSEAKVQELLQEAQKETRKEKGCIKYDLIQDNADPTVFVSQMEDEKIRGCVKR